MTWLTFLSNTSAVVQITANVIVMFYVFPAYQRTGRRAFLLLGFSCLVGTFDTLCDYTLGLSRMAHADYVAYRTLRRCSYFLAVGLGATGTVLLTQSYLQLSPPKLTVQPDGNLPR